MPTIGVEFTPKNMVLPDDTKVRLQLWDTGNDLLLKIKIFK